MKDFTRNNIHLYLALAAGCLLLIAITLLAPNGSAAETSVVGMAPLSVVEVTVSPSTVLEDGTQNLVYTIRRTGSISGPIVVNYSVSGTTTPGNDYTGVGASGGWLAFVPEQTELRLFVDPTADSKVEPVESVVITLHPGPGCLVGPKYLATGRIANDDLSWP